MYRNGVNAPRQGSAAAGIWAAVTEFNDVYGRSPTYPEAIEATAAHSVSKQYLGKQLSLWRRFHGLSKARVAHVLSLPLSTDVYLKDG